MLYTSLSLSGKQIAAEKRPFQVQDKEVWCVPLLFHPQEIRQLISNGCNRGNKKRGNLYYFHDWIYSRFYFFEISCIFFFFFTSNHLLNAFFIGNVPRVNAEISAVLPVTWSLMVLKSQQRDKWHIAHTQASKGSYVLRRKNRLTAFTCLGILN